MTLEPVRAEDTPMNRHPPLKRCVARTRGGHTLLELVMAAFVMGLVLVPALVLMRRSMELSRKLDTHNMMTTLAISKLEQHLAASAATFTEQTDSGDFTAEGHPELRFVVDRSADPADGGITDELMAVVVTVWHDEDGDQAQDADEPATSFGSKIAKMATYEDEASGT